MNSSLSRVFHRCLTLSKKTKLITPCIYVIVYNAYNIVLQHRKSERITRLELR